MTWAIPAAFPGGTVVVMASGPSMGPEVAAKIQASGLPAIVVNTTYLLAPWAWMLYAADWRWWRSNPAALKFRGLKVSVEEARQPGIVHLLRNTGIDGFDPDPTCVKTGNNSGYQATHCAIHATRQCGRVLLTGFDMDGGHWHDDGEGELRRDWITRMEYLAELMRGRVDIINCTPGSAIKCFPAMELDEALEKYGVQGRGARGATAAAD